MKLVTIGGGELATFQTLPIDREIVRLTGKKHPNALFIPTASGDAIGYWESFQKVYGKKLGCQTDVLFLLRKSPSHQEIKQKIISADLIYVGGGNTLKMMRRWRHLGVDKLLRKAAKRGAVLAGLSAGCICWYRWGHSDSMSFYHPKNWDYIRVKGMGFINAIGCPHYDGEKRDTHFEKMIHTYGGMGIAIDNNCAMEFVGNQYRVITSRKGAYAYKVFKKNKKIITETIPQKKEWKLTRVLFLQEQKVK